MAGFQPDPGADPRFVNLDDFETEASTSLAPAPWAYFSGGANDERTMADCRAAFARRRILPRVMRDLSMVDTSVSLLGRRWPWPILVAPTAFHRMAHPDGEMGTARAVAARVMTLTLSTSASTDVAEVAPVGGPLWFQVYLLADPGARRHLVERAVAAGVEALVLTVDLARLGRRERDIRAGFRIPAEIGLPNIAAAAGVPATEAASVPFADRVTWDDLDWLRGFGLPVLVKGILHPDDARLAVDHGAAGVWVSNHGGRQLDGAIPSLDALPAVVDAVGGQVPVLLDGGVRRGTDMLVALALGASAVAIGRPVIWGLAVDGEAGVGKVLDLLTAEFAQAMALSGMRSVAEVSADLISQEGSGR